MPWTRHVFLSCQNDMFVHQTRMNLPRSPDCTHIHVDIYVYMCVCVCVYMCVCGYLSLSFFLFLSLVCSLLLYVFGSEMPSPSPKCLLSLVERTITRFVSPVSQAREETPSPP